MALLHNVKNELILIVSHMSLLSGDVRKSHRASIVLDNVGSEVLTLAQHWHVDHVTSCTYVRMSVELPKE